MVDLVQGLDARDLEDRALLQMILQVASDTGLVEHRRNAVLAKPIGRADARALQDHGGGDGAGRQHDLAPGARLEKAAVLAEAHADTARALEHQSVDQDFGQKPQVRSIEHRLQEGARRRPAHAALLVHVEIANAEIFTGIEVGSHRDAHFGRGLLDRIEYIPFDARPFDSPFAATAVMLGIAQEMIVEALEDRQDVIPAPATQAQLPPMIVVRRLAAHRDHGIDGRAAADDLAARIAQATAVQAGLALGLEHPVRARIANGEEVADWYVEPDPVVVATGLQDQHARL